MRSAPSIIWDNVSRILPLRCKSTSLFFLSFFLTLSLPSFMFYLFVLQPSYTTDSASYMCHATCAMKTNNPHPHLHASLHSGRPEPHEGLPPSCIRLRLRGPFIAFSVHPCMWPDPSTLFLTSPFHSLPAFGTGFLFSVERGNLAPPTLLFDSKPLYLTGHLEDWDKQAL